MSVPKLFRITLDTNPEDCNLRCIMCEEHSSYSCFKKELFNTTGIRRRLMPPSLILQLFKQAKELGVEEIIPSTMGEPLLYEHIDVIYEQAKLHGIKINLTTNGTFPRRPIEEWAKIIVPHTSDVKISWNGATAETYNSVMRGGDFNKALCKLKKFIAWRNQYYQETSTYCRITLQLTFMSHTMHEIPDIVQMATQLGIDRIKGHHLWAHFPEIKDYAIPPHPAYYEKWNKYVAECYKIQKECLKPDGTAIILENLYPIKDTNETPNLQQELVCPFLGRELWISATGTISPCCAPDKLRRSLGDFGNIYETSLKEVLLSPSYIDLQRKYKEHSLCKTCNMRRPL